MLDQWLDRVVCMDALELMQSLPDASIDALFTDPPYNMTELEFEGAIDWLVFWSQARRVLKDKHSPAILFSQQPFTTDLIVSNRKGFRMEIIYEKSNAVGFLNAADRPLQAHENMLVFADGAVYYDPQFDTITNEKKGTVQKQGKAKHYGKHQAGDYHWTGKRYPRSVWKFSQAHTFDRSDIQHPTQKPQKLLERLILTFTKPGWIILDPFCGSGSTLLAARNLERHFVGGDNDESYVDLATRKLSQFWTPCMPGLI